MADDLQLAREWLRGISDDAEDAVALAAIMTCIRLDEAKWWAKHIGSWTNETARHMNLLEMKVGEQAAGGSAAGSQK